MPVGLFEVAILGGGPAGCAAATALARSGVAVQLFERSPGPREAVGEVVTPEILRPLYALNAAERFSRDGHLPLAGISSQWGSSNTHETDFLLNPNGPGWSLDRKRFHALLLDTATGAGARLDCGAQVREVIRERDGGWRLAVQMGAEMRFFGADFLLLASGRSAAIPGLKVGRIAGSRTLAAAAYFPNPRGTADTGGRLRVEATPEGWWYAAPLPERRVVITHFTDPQLFPGSAARRWELWKERQRRLSWASEFPDLPSFAHLKLVPAGFTRAATIGGDGWLAIGDAALAIDPLAGQGILRALNSGLAAAQALLEKHAQGTRQLSDYTRQFEEGFLEAAATARAYYRSENRWSGEPFWRCRRM